MDDVTAQVALISTSGTVAVALIGALGALFGDHWREAKAARATAKAAEDTRRYTMLQLFAAALLKATQMWSWEERLAVDAARVDFIATLRSGEGAVAEFTSDLIASVASRKPAQAALQVATDGADQLFAWLRGDRTLDDLKVLEVLVVNES